MEKKNQAGRLAATLDEENAGETHLRMLEAVHKEPPAHDNHKHHNDLHGGDDEKLSEVELEYIQDKMVNNFRPVQPLNGRVVYRSFKLGEGREGGGSGGGHHGYRPSRGDGEGMSNEDVLRERLKLYGSTDSGAGSVAAASSLAALAVLLLAGLAAALRL